MTHKVSISPEANENGKDFVTVRVHSSVERELQALKVMLRKKFRRNVAKSEVVSLGLAAFRREEGLEGEDERERLVYAFRSFLNRKKTPIEEEVLKHLLLAPEFSVEKDSEDENES